MIRVWPWPLAPAVHSTRKRRSASGTSSDTATGPAGHAVASAAPSSSVIATIIDRHGFIGIPPVPWGVTGSTVAAAVSTAAVEAAPAVKSSRDSAGTESPVEVTEALLAHLSGLMRQLVLGGRPAEAGPIPASAVFLPVAPGVPTVHVAVATRIYAASADAPTSDVSMIDEVIPGDVNVVAPVLLQVHVADAVMPAPAAAAMPPPAVMPAPVGTEGEAELEPGEDVDPEAQVERAPAPGHRPRIPERAGPTRIDVAGAIDHDWSGRHHGAEIARRVARVHHVR